MAERYELYNSLCDIKIDNDKDINVVIDSILKEVK